MLKSMMSVQLELENMHTPEQRQRLMYGEGLGGGGIVARTMNMDCIDSCDLRGLMFRQCMSEAMLLTLVRRTLCKVKGLLGISQRDSFP